MAVSFTLVEHTNHHGAALLMLRRLAALQADQANASFSFDVSRQRCDLVASGNGQIATAGELSLAIYNDLKLSQYIREDDNLSTREQRHFSLTDRGHAVAARTHD
jgi:hypothetical protein